MTSPSPVRRVALIGSSFAAGPDIDPVIHESAGRSGNNYGELVARRLGAGITDLAVSGATTANMLSTRQRHGRTRFAPQLPQLPDDADLILITGGGNDLRYLQSIMPALAAGWLSQRAATRPLARLARRMVGTPKGKDVELPAAGLAQLVRGARQRATAARVILVGYPTLFGPGSLAAVADYLRPEDVSAMERIGQRLNHAYELAAERTGAELIKTWELSREHAIGSAEPWVNGLRGVPGDGSPLHPNAAGHRAMANAVLALLGSE